MSGRILIVDDNVTRRITLAARLSGAFYDIQVAGSDTEAIEIMDEWRPSVLLVADELSCMPAAQFLRQVRSIPLHENITIFVVTAAGAQTGRAGLLTAGADEVIPRSEPEDVFKARLRSHERARDMIDTLRLRGDAGRLPGLREASSAFLGKTRVTLIAQTEAQASDWQAALGPLPGFRMEFSFLPEIARNRVLPDEAGLIVLGVVPGQEHRTFRLLSEIQAHRERCDMEILLFAPDASPKVIAEGYEVGAGSIMCGPFDAAEIAARLRALQMRLARRRGLRRALADGLKASITDPLTGLYNRRFALPRLAQIARMTARGDRGFAVMVIDLDHFKRVNDLHGHVIGDLALKSVARTLRCNLGPDDLIARIGGEEFLVALPDTDPQTALAQASRLCDAVRESNVPLPGHESPLTLTISVGVTLGKAGTRTSEELIADADRALYTAKHCGRDQVALQTRSGTSAAGTIPVLRARA